MAKSPFITIHAEKKLLESFYLNPNNSFYIGLSKNFITDDTITLTTISTYEPTEDNSYQRQSIVFGLPYQTNAYSTTISNNQAIQFPAWTVDAIPIRTVFITDGVDVLNIFNFDNGNGEYITSAIGQSILIPKNFLSIGLE